MSDEELLSIILKDGTKGISVKNISLKLLETTKGLQGLKDITYENLLKIKGIGNAKACAILALIEINRRLNITIKNLKNLRLTNTQMVFDYYKNVFNNELQEKFYCIYLDTSKKVIKDKLLFVGTINHSLVHPREIFREAYLLGASAIICIHNHPSGNIMPSKEDIKLTHNLQQVGLLLGVSVLDHIIIGKKNYYSFLENGNI